MLHKTELRIALEEFDAGFFQLRIIVGIDAVSADHFTTVNEIYALVVGDPAPARSAPIVAALPRGFLISVEAIAKR